MFPKQFAKRDHTFPIWRRKRNFTSGHSTTSREAATYERRHSNVIQTKGKRRENIVLRVDFFITKYVRDNDVFWNGVCVDVLWGDVHKTIYGRDKNVFFLVWNWYVGTWYGGTYIKREKTSVQRDFSKRTS